MSGDPPPQHQWLDFLRYVFGADDVIRRFRQLVWLIAGTALLLAILAAVSIAAAPQSAITAILGGAAITAGVSAVGSFIAFRKLARGRLSEDDESDEQVSRYTQPRRSERVARGSAPASCTDGGAGESMPVNICEFADDLLGRLNGSKCRLRSRTRGISHTQPARARQGSNRSSACDTTLVRTT